jgi:hypothetical protein
VADKRPDPVVPVRFDDAQIEDDLTYLTVYEVADRRLPEIVAKDLRGKKPDTPAA